MHYPFPPNQQDYYEQVWDLVRQVPHGKVVTYGQVGQLVSPPDGIDSQAYKAWSPRWVGDAMAACPADVPWQRVINAQGRISERPGAQRQRRLLEQEGIVFVNDRVDLKRYQWLGPGYADEPVQASLFSWKHLMATNEHNNFTQIVAIHEQTATVAYAHIFPDTPFPRAETLRRWQTFLGRLLVAEVANVLVGFVAFDAQELHALYVLPSYQGQGIGQQLLTAAGAVSSLWVLQENHAARRFYAARGWIPDGTERMAFGVVEMRYRHPALKGHCPAIKGGNP